MTFNEIFKKSGLTICCYDNMNDEYYPLKSIEIDLVFRTLADSKRLHDEEKILILAGLAYVGGAEESECKNPDCASKIDKKLESEAQNGMD